MKAETDHQNNQEFQPCRNVIESEVQVCVERRKEDSGEHDGAHQRAPLGSIYFWQGVRFGVQDIFSVSGHFLSWESLFFCILLLVSLKWACPCVVTGSTESLQSELKPHVRYVQAVALSPHLSSTNRKKLSIGESCIDIVVIVESLEELKSTLFHHLWSFRWWQCVFGAWTDIVVLIPLTSCFWSSQNYFP